MKLGFKFYVSAFALFCMFTSLSFAASFENDEFGEFAREEKQSSFQTQGTPVFELKNEALEKMHRDFQSDPVPHPFADAGLIFGPDRSFRTIWVRMFPLLSVPYKDPYPVTQNRNEVFLFNSRGLKIVDLYSKKVIAEGERVYFNFTTDLIRIDESEYPLSRVWIVPESPFVYTTARWDRWRKDKDGSSLEMKIELRGQFVVQKSPVRESKDEFWSLVNVINIEDYLYSVLPSEMWSKFQDEALKSQAIAARTYALYEMAVARDLVADVGVGDIVAETKLPRNWDVEPSTWFQSYKGVEYNDRKGRRTPVEKPLLNHMVDLTKHQVMTYKGGVIKAFFSASSGGITCRPRECFGWKEESKDPEYLVPVEDAPGIRDVLYGVWGKDAVINPETIYKRLMTLDEIDKATRPLSIFSARKGETGRTWSLGVRTENFGTIKLSRKQTKRMLGLFGRIRSHLFELSAIDETGHQKVIGHGFGHGVGMSQWGAELFARQGWTHDQILKRFYTGVEIEEL